MRVYLFGKKHALVRYWQALTLSLMLLLVSISGTAQDHHESFSHHLYVKTNTIGWGMLIANLSAEIDLSTHWSFTLPVYYSSWNYFASKVKFRTFALQPETRYWFAEGHTGWFAGAHLGLAWFNYAKGGGWRYQDHSRQTPALGGGVSGGYRLSINADRKWWMEFSLGTGIYHLHYDIFHNEQNGKHVAEKKRTFYGIDQVAVSFVYRFDLQKGGKK